MNAGAIHIPQNTPESECADFFSQPTAQRQLHTRLTTIAGPMLNASVPKLIAVLAASWRAAASGDASVDGSKASSRSDHKVGPPLALATGMNQASAQPATTASASSRR